jgi:hypothetical protein
MARNERRETFVEGMAAILLKAWLQAKSHAAKKSRPLRGEAMSGLVGEVLRGGG